MCAGCRKRLPKGVLVRLAVEGDGRLTVDERKVVPGRGVYLCPHSACLESAIKRKGILKGFRGKYDKDVPEGVLRYFEEEGEWRK
jgi:predicted RNA-binding protein YlxR (DUF448 family)